MKRTDRGFLEEVSEQPDPELDQMFVLAREVAEPGWDNRQRVSMALHAALSPTAPPGRVPMNRVGSDPDAKLLGASLPNGSRAALRARGAGKWLLLGAALIGGGGFWLGHAVGRGEQPTAVPAAFADDDGAALDDDVTALSRGAAAQASPPEPPASVEPPASATPERARTAPPLSEVAVNATDVANRTSRARAAPRADRGSAMNPEQAEPGLSFREVLDQLRRAQQHLKNGHAAVSLLLLADLDRSAGELLWEERETTRILALCAGGQDKAARRAAAALERQSPESIYSMRLSDSCVAESRDPE
jgi:hypothetical protein